MNSDLKRVPTLLKHEKLLTEKKIYSFYINLDEMARNRDKREIEVSGKID